jgi:hypothetical protein
VRTPETVSTSPLSPAASPVATPIPQDDSPYWRFYDAVASAQLAEWLPSRPSQVLDISGAATSPAS